MSNRKYPLNEQKLENMNIRLLNISQSRYGTDWDSIQHTHPFMEIFYVTKGTGEFLVETTRFQVQQDDLIIINADIPHTEFGIKEKSFEYIVLGLDGTQFVERNEKVLGNYSVHNYYEYKDEVLFCLHALLSEVQKKEDGFDLICQNLLEVLMINIIRRAKKKLFFTPVKGESKECKFIEDYIDEHFREDITLEKLSQVAYLNKYYIVHAFKEYKGVSPINYLISKRISEAKILLTTTNFSILEISKAIGFSSQTYFSQTFKKEVAMSPIQYRKAQTNQNNSTDI